VAEQGVSERVSEARRVRQVEKEGREGKEEKKKEKRGEVSQSLFFWVK
jgi:hypothetical protein